MTFSIWKAVHLHRNTFNKGIFFVFIACFFCHFAESKNVNQYSLLNLSSGLFNQKIDESSHYKTLDLSLSNAYKYQNSGLSYAHNLGLVYQNSNDFNSFNFFISEFYLSRKTQLGEISIGRKRQEINLADQEWALGLTQSLFLHDPLNPVYQGQFGVHHQFNTKSFFINSFLSYVHLPHQGAKFKIKDQKIRSGNPWFNSPPVRLIEESGSTDIKYGLKKSDLQDVVFQPSFSLQMGMNYENFAWDLSYVNQVNNEYHKSYRFSQELNPNHIFVDIDVSTTRQQLYSANLKWNSNDFNYWLSYIKDQPQKKYLKNSSWVETHLDQQDWVAFGVNKENIFIDQLSLSSSYIKRFSAKNKKNSLLNFEQLNSIISRSYFERSDSINLKADYKYNISKNEILTAQARLEYSFDNKSELVESKLNYAKDKMNVFARAGIISAQKKDKESFQSKFKGNDFINIGIGYVF